MTWDMNISEVAPAYTPSRGPRHGFLGALEASWEASLRTQSYESLAWYFSKEDEEQERVAREKGIEYTPLYRKTIAPTPNRPTHENLGWRQYYYMAKAIVDGDEDGSNPAVQHIREQDELIAKLNADNPGLNLRTMRDLFDTTKQKAAEAERVASLDRSWLGSAGAFIGDVLGNVDPRVNLPNFLTLGVGGIGKTIGMRMLTQGVGQGLIETFNQFTGVQEQRRMLGLEHGTENALWNIGGAVVGGVALQGVGEGFAAGLRRWRTGSWFKEPDAPQIREQPPQTPNAPDKVTPDGNPIPTLYGPNGLVVDTNMNRTRFGRPRVQQDLENAYEQLADWGGPHPRDLEATTAIRTPDSEPSFNYRRKFPAMENLDDAARRFDPEVYAARDKLVAENDGIRRQLNELGAERKADAETKVADIDARINALKDRVDAATRRNAKKYLAEIDDLQATRKQLVDEMLAGDTPEMATLRKRLLDNMYKFTDELQPSIQNARAKAEGKWALREERRRAIDEQIKRDALGEPQPVEPPSRLPERIPDIPTRDPLSDARRAPNGVGKDEPLVEAALRASKEDAKVAEVALDAFRKDLKDAVKDENATELVGNVNGKEVKLPLNEKMAWVDDEGNVVQKSIREIAKDLDEDDAVLRAVSTCSLKGTS